MQLHGQLKIFPPISQGELSQIPINIFLWLQVMAFRVVVIPSLTLPWYWLGTLKPMEQAANLDTANIPYIPLWGIVIETKREIKVRKSRCAQQNEKLWLKAPEVMDNRP